MLGYKSEVNHDECDKHRKQNPESRPAEIVVDSSVYGCYCKVRVDKASPVVEVGSFLFSGDTFGYYLRQNLICDKFLNIFGI